MSNREPITVINSGAGGFDVEIRYNGYPFGVSTTQTQESLKFQADYQFQMRKLRHVLKNALDTLKIEVLLEKAMKRIQPPSARASDKPLDDP